MGIYGVATTHDAFRLWAARADAASLLTSAGIQRQCISGGYEFDGWTEVEDGGHFARIDDTPPRGTPVEYFFLRLTPHVQPKYYMVTSVQEKLQRPPMAQVAYRTWLSPRERHVFMQADPQAACPAR
jgi:hypothetical protein